MMLKKHLHSEKKKKMLFLGEKKKSDTKLEKCIFYMFRFHDGTSYLSQNTIGSADQQ